MIIKNGLQGPFPSRSVAPAFPSAPATLSLHGSLISRPDQTTPSISGSPSVNSSAPTTPSVPGFPLMNRPAPATPSVSGFSGPDLN